MKKLLLIVILCQIFVFSFGQNKNTNNDKYQAYMNMLDKLPYKTLLTSSPENQPKIQEWQKRVEFERLKTIDPATGELSAEEMIKSRNYVDNLLVKRKSSKKMAGIPNVKWKELGPTNVGGRTRGVMFDPTDSTNRKVWSGGVSGGLWYNENIRDSESEWKKIDDFWESLAVTCLAYDPTNPKIFYAGTGEIEGGSGVVFETGYIWKSEDAGKTWKRLPNKPSGSFYMYRIVINKTGELFVATGSGIQKSSDGGMTWKTVLVSSVGGATDIEMAADQIIYVATNAGKIYHSNDETGNQWTDISPPNNLVGSRTELGLALSTKGEQQVIYAYENLQWMKKSIDAGKTWKDITIPQNDAGQHFVGNQGWYDLVITVHPTNPDLVYANGTGITRTLDGGKTWEPFGYGFIHPDHHGVVFNEKNTDEVLFACDGGMYFSSNAGKNMTERPKINVRNKGYNVTQFYSLAIRNIQNDETIIGGTQDNGTWKINNSIAEPGMQIGGGDGAYCFIDQDEPDIMIASYQNGMFFNIDRNGRNYQTLITQEEGSFINPADYNSVTNTLFANYSSRTKVRRVKVSLTQNSKDFLELGTDIGAAPSAFKTASNNVLFLGTYGGKVFKVNNTDKNIGNTQEIGAKRMPTGYINCIEMGATENELLVVYSNTGISSVWYTNDGGNNWVNKDSTNYGLPNVSVKWAVFNPNNRKQVMLATNLGIWTTDDITAANPAWEISNSGLANVRCDMIKCRASDGFVAIGTHGRGIYTSYVFAPSTVNNKITTALKTEQKKNCGGNNISIPFTTTGIFAQDEEYSVYLSNANGNFSTEQLIGKGDKSPIICTYPTQSVGVTNLLSSNNYRIKIIASKTGISSESSENISIYLPTAVISGAVNNICTGFSTTIQASEIKNSYSYQWKRGGIILPNANSDKLTVNQAGIYTLEVSEQGCLAASSNYSINVGSIDYPNVTVPTSNTCEGLKIPLSTASKPDYTLQWFKDGVAILGETKPNFVVVTSGKYLLNYRQGNCSANSAPLPIYIGKNLSVDIIGSFKPNEVNCKGSSQYVYFKTTTTSDMNFQWQFEGKDIAGAVNSYLKTEKSGNYALRLAMGKCSATSLPIKMNFVDSLNTTISTEFDVRKNCKGGKITLISSYQPYYSAIYTWKKNQIPIGTSQYFKYEVAESGDYSVSINQGNCTASSENIKLQIDTTNNLPVKLRSSWAKETCTIQPLNYIELENTSIYSPEMKFTWKKDGQVIANSITTYLPATQSGTYTLTAQKEGCQGTSEGYVYKVGNTLSAPLLSLKSGYENFSVSKEMNFCDGQNVSLSCRFDPSLSYLNFLGTYQWQKDGKNIPNATEQYYNVKEAGNYTLAIQLGSCSAISAPVKVNYNLVPNEITPNVAQTICDKTSTVLKAVSTDKDLVYQWTKNNEIIANNISNIINVNQAGNYRFVVNRGLCSNASELINFKLNPTPIAKITADKDASTLCAGQTISLFANKDSGLTYQWLRDSVKIEKATTSTFQLSEDGKYSVITNDGKCSNISEALKINFIKVPTAISPTGSEQNLCEKSTLSLMAIDNNDPDVKYQWKRNNENINTATTNGIKVTQEGSYQYIATKGPCTVNSSTVNVKVISLPKTDITYTGDPTLLCIGENFTMNILKEDGVSYQWKKDSLKIEKAIDPIFQVNQSGKYSLEASRNNCSANSLKINIIFNEKPTASLSGGGNMYPSESGTLKVDLTSLSPWLIKVSDGKEYTVNQTPFNFVVTAVDTSAFTIISVSNRCGVGISKGSIKFKILSPLGTDELLLNEPILMATVPNPFKESCTIKYGLPKPDAVKIAVYDMQGTQKIVLIDEYTSAGWHSFLFISKSLKEGTYILKLEINGHVKTQKIVLTSE